MKKICCFIDILGFKEAVNNNSAFDLLENYQGTFEIAEIVNSIFNGNKYTSFCDFIPMSDSLFITGVVEAANLFLKDLSTFLAEVFLYNSGISKKITLFKGAISYDELETIEQNCKLNFKMNKQNNIVGKAVNNAVLVDFSNRSNKGPRIFIDDAFYAQLKKDSIEKYILVENNTKELLWPYYAFDSNNDFVNELIKYKIEWLKKSLELYNCYKNEIFSEHYEEFVKLVIKTAVQTAKRRRNYDELKKEFESIIPVSPNFNNLL
ncbi:hypothetical protein [Treponema denticola]|uniref:hypothetical protein n=1 Tax=Treponema denticola TaxID=158 RepID=UPI0020A335D3|nr:hypothetical protein [Treponema denticola]UTC88888.1 hypothetical protein E4N79_12390 [Treponema denticola]UYT07776.1 hypothetical protein OE909_12550 [Treponema denticola]